MSTEDKNKLPIKVEYRLDQFLMYLIQEVTGRPSADIMNFFHELCTQVAELGLEKRTGKSIKKKIDDYFPNSSIPFHIDLEGWPRQDSKYDEKARGWISLGEKFFCRAEVTFPSRPTYMKQEQLNEIADFLLERDLLGVEVPANIKPFERPEVKSPKMYKDLMDRFAGRPVEEKKTRKKKNEDSGSSG